MQDLRVILASGFLVLSGTHVFAAGPSRPARALTPPLVVLSPEIEELDMSEPAVAPAAAAVTVPRPAEPAVLVPRQLFPSARLMFKRLSGNSAPPVSAPAGQSEQLPASPPETSRAVVTISQLEPLPTPLGATPEPSPELIRPMLPPVETVPQYPPEDLGCVAEPHEVAPRTHRVGSRLRFPQFSQLMSRIYN